MESKLLAIEQPKTCRFLTKNKNGNLDGALPRLVSHPLAVKVDIATRRCSPVTQRHPQKMQTLFLVASGMPFPLGKGDVLFHWDDEGTVGHMEASEEDGPFALLSP